MEPEWNFANYRVPQPMESAMFRGFILWLLGVPLIVIIALALFTNIL
jgi:hypothetical protein